ncbi:hypothetical protein LTR56_011552 [Elasticomyces elasticus]|nr:hypothetical protein LTR56_011552 [Elasticomyces elasticus]KAK3643281.1 hypothetical protein LTR22_015748 [Elasticomyces elasticus]KAK4930272.1 hypothetical protein LTR49_003306 [Elasticomyces elasticus]KAK5763159.1 hypothetical protein LTS12_006748 [Elasticomyces elasticus]
MAADLGKKLLEEVEEMGLDEILAQLRLQHDHIKFQFGVGQLDYLLSADDRTTKSAQRIVELTSKYSGGGTTHLLYHLTALSVLPSNLGGKAACVVIIDTDGTFDVARLAQQLQLVLKDDTAPEQNLEDIVLSSLKHVHIFRPQSLASTTATLEALPSYLLDKSRHYSIDRAVRFVAIDSASAFYWQTKAEEENASIYASDPDLLPSRRPPSTYQQLTAALKASASALCCPLILTTHHLDPISTNAHDSTQSLRPTLPAPLSNLPTLRLIVHRLPVRKFPAGISLEEAHREAPNRQSAVDAGKFACALNEWNVDERLLRRLHREGRMSFGFCVSNEGLTVDAEKNAAGS